MSEEIGSADFFVSVKKAVEAFENRHRSTIRSAGNHPMLAA